MIAWSLADYQFLQGFNKFKESLQSFQAKGNDLGIRHLARMDDCGKQMRGIKEADPNNKRYNEAYGFAKKSFRTCLINSSDESKKLLDTP